MTPEQLESIRQHCKEGLGGVEAYEIVPEVQGLLDLIDTQKDVITDMEEDREIANEVIRNLRTELDHWQRYSIVPPPDRRRTIEIVMK